MLREAVQKGLVLLIRAYQIVISSWTQQGCRFHPSCSNYAQEAIQKHGVIRGLYFTLCRLLRCHPFHSGGFDPVPREKSEASWTLKK